ncbi:lanthionine synthetase LanC family protein [Pedobacter sp. CFBP9032]|uniref:lanthionine synthetase LanC family protein n=1 Tax=Pedobacter sp. CFBP9032 TaxID=3096539 RepID=UPI002A6A574B|nr:lanthionine synthetase LanC family protein [Pedobacter sp. CFBP9032]MDY0905131.1 lanthionine synthetase LanC family protein [Pedobacter sp. CFBP9032]
MQKDEGLMLGLFEGASGLALLGFYLSKQIKVSAFEEKSFALLEYIITSLNEEQYGKMKIIHSLSEGITGIAYTFWHLNKYNFIDFDFEESFSGYDELLFNLARDDFAKGTSDFLHGPMGVLFYFSKRLEQPKVKAYAGHLINDFLLMSKRDSYGLRIHNLILEGTDIRDYDFGLAHGLPGQLLIMSKCLDKGLNDLLINKMITEGLLYLRNHRRDCFGEEIDSIYPSWINEDYGLYHSSNDANYKCRLAWCYGDLSIALAFIQIGKNTRNQSVIDDAIEIGLATTSRLNPKENLVTDIYVCHGSSGIMHMYRRLFIATNLKAFSDAFDHWNNTTRTWLEHSDLRSPKLNNMSILEGLTGLCLSFLPEIEENYWDDILLLS